MSQKSQQANDRTTPVNRSITVPVPVERAFAVFTAEMGSWWNPANTFSRDTFATVIVEPKAGGRWYERTTIGSELDWGRVLVWEPPRRVVLTWQITAQGTPEPDPAKASTVDIRFTAEAPNRTRIDLEHRDFEKHGGDAGAIWHDGMESDETGWAFFLKRYRRAAAGG